jgi:RimJ/RimL family protein N-acetyltransferase
MSFHSSFHKAADSFPGILHAPRVRLRPLELADAPRIARFTADWDVARMTSALPFPQTQVAAEGWILILQARAPLAKDHVFAIDLPGDGLIGVIGAHRKALPTGQTGAELGFWVARPFWGRGFASEAARVVAAHARTLTVGPVGAGHFADNPASGRVLSRAGFAYTGDILPAYSLARNARVPMRWMELPSPQFA